MAVHENQHYKVVVGDPVDGAGVYDVVNLETNVIEESTNNLPDALFAAENLNAVLVHKTYEWIGKRARERAAQEIGLVPSNGSQH